MSSLCYRVDWLRTGFKGGRRVLVRHAGADNVGPCDKAALLAHLSPKVTELRIAAQESRERTRLRQRRTRRAGIWAAAMGAAAFAVLWMTGGFSPWKRFETEIGEQSTMKLSDGSVVILNARSRGHRAQVGR